MIYTIIYFLFIYNYLFSDYNEPPTLETFDTYMVNLSSFLKTGNVPSLTENVKKAVSNLDISQLN